MQNIDSDLIRGNIDTIILKTMLNEDKYGLDIIKEVEQRSSGTYELKQPTLYSCLKRLENQELISSYWLNSDIGGRRHYYKLTDKGREFYNKKQEEWAKSKFVIDNLLSNYDYEEYRLVKKDDYDKAMNNINQAEPEEDNAEEIIDNNVSISTSEDSFDGEKPDVSEDFNSETFENIDFSSSDSEYDIETASLEISETENSNLNIEEDDIFDFDDNALENFDDNNDQEPVYVSNSNDEEALDENETHETPSYTLPDQTQNENNILDMLRRQQKEEINTYEGDKKSYASQIKSIYDDVKYVQDDMVVFDYEEDHEDQVDRKIKEFTEAVDKLDEFSNQNVGIENEECDFENDVETNFDEQSTTEDLVDDYAETLEEDEFDKEENNELDLEIENNIQEEYQEDCEDFDFSISDDEIKEPLNDSFEAENNSFDIENDFNQRNTSFFSSNESITFDKVDISSDQPSDYEKPEEIYQFESQSFSDFEPSQFESYHSNKFNKDEYDSTFINVKKDSEENFSETDDDIDDIITRNISSKPQMQESSNNFFERRYVNENYKQKLSNLTIYSKATTANETLTSPASEDSQADDMETLKCNFEREGIKVREHKKISSYEEPEKTYLLANKINLFKSLILLFGYAFVLSGMYIILQNSSFGILTEGFSIKYFLIGLIPFAILAIYHLIIYLVSPYKKVPARVASRIMIFLAVILTVQLLLITYCVNLQLGFYSFTQAGYNHLLWVVPTVISFGPIISNLIYMALFYSGNFNV